MLNQLTLRSNFISRIFVWNLPFFCTLLVVTVFPLMGCKQIPKTELTQYRAAFGKVQSASEEILVDFAEVLERSQAYKAKVKAEKEEEAEGASSYIAYVFTDELPDLDGFQLTDVEVRRLALHTIDKYNNALTTLAEGKSVESVQAATGGFVDSLSTFLDAGGSAVPGLSAVTDIAQTLVAQVEKARLRKEFEKAVLDGAPIVQKILNVMIAYRGDHLRLRSEESTRRQVEIVDEITSAARAIRTIVGDHQAPVPVSPDVLIDIEGALNEVLEPTKLFAKIKLTYGAAGTPFSETDRVLAEETILRIRAAALAYQANITQYETLKNALNSYGVMLDMTRATLNTLVKSLDHPQDFEEASDELFKIAFSIKRDINAIKAARSAARK